MVKPWHIFLIGGFVLRSPLIIAFGTAGAVVDYADKKLKSQIPTEEVPQP